MSTAPGRISLSSALVYVCLVAATLFSWELPGASRSAAFATAVILGVAALKIAVIGLEFMELRRAHWVLRGVFLLWAAVVGVALILLFSWPLYGGHT